MITTTKKICIKQPFYLKYLAAFKRFVRQLTLIKNDKQLQRVTDTWYNLEQANDAPFRWSHPIAKLKIKNLGQVVLTVTDPLGRSICVTTKEINQTIKLNAGETTMLIVDVHDADELCVSVEPFNPDNDTRSLGIQYLSITDRPCVVLN